MRACPPASRMHIESWCPVTTTVVRPAAFYLSKAHSSRALHVRTSRRAIASQQMTSQEGQDQGMRKFQPTMQRNIDCSGCADDIGVQQYCCDSGEGTGTQWGSTEHTWRTYQQHQGHSTGVAEQQACQVRQPRHVPALVRTELPAAGLLPASLPALCSSPSS